MILKLICVFLLSLDQTNDVEKAEKEIDSNCRHDFIHVYKLVIKITRMYM